MKQVRNVLLRNILVQAAFFLTLGGALSTENKRDIYISSETKLKQTLPFFSQLHNGIFEKENKDSKPLCDTITVKHGNFLILTNGSLYVPFYKKIFAPSSYRLIENTTYLCLNKSANLLFNNSGDVIDISLKCAGWSYGPEEYRILDNGSIAIGDEIYSGRLKFFDQVLYTCYDDHGEEYNITVDELAANNQTLSSAKIDHMTLVYVGNVGCGLSIAAIIVYLIVFVLIKELRTPPGYNLTSLNVTLLLGYFFFLLAQHPKVVGTFCVICAVCTQYFFLSSFFWMNCLSFDLWRTLWCAIKKLQISSTKRKIKKFVIYSLYSWGMALIFIIAAVIVDNHPDTPHDMRPAFGMNGSCKFNGKKAQKIFFVVPGGTLLVVNAMFFCHSTFLVLTNSMKDNDNHQSTAKRNFLLYVRLGVIMGITWLVGIIAIFDSSDATSMIFGLLNSSQGLFMFLLFISSRKTWKQIRGRMRRQSLVPLSKNTSSDAGECSSSEKDSRIVKETALCESQRKTSNSA